MNPHILANHFLNYLTKIHVDQNINDWVCQGKTDITYGSPNGGWDGINGFLFVKKDNSYRYIIRSIPRDTGSYIVIESLNIKGQLYNMDLSNPKICKERQGKTYLLESYRMTVGRGKKKEIEVENSFKAINVTTNEISIIEDLQPDWSKTLTDILEWAILREKVKILLKKNNTKIFKVNYKEAYSNWLDTKISNTSGTKNSYIRSIDLLSDTLGYQIFEENDIEKIDLLYNDLKAEQTIEGGKYWNAKAPSYGQDRFYSAAINSYSSFLKNYLSEKTIMETSRSTPLLNQILYGPPGTGKTYKLQQIIEDWNLKEKTSTEIDYTSFVKNYTWWQVIGLALLEKENITVPELAKHPLIIAKLGSSSVKRLNTRLWSSLQHHTVDECENVKLVHRVGERVFYKEANSEWRLDNRTLFQIEFMPLVDAFEEFKKSDDTKKSKDYTFTTCHQSLTYEDFIEGIKPDLSKENLEDDEDERSEKVVYEIRKGIFYNACEKASQKAGFINLKDCLERTKDERKYLFEKAIAENKIHVIFLDEINRCNVSSVFGELITLIEDDKRLGRENEIADITLPYSQEEFGVPANLFIIGTMNTADRSVEALDAALRRRFCFEEMPPLYDLKELQNDIFGYRASEILKTINLRIEKLLDKDHKIGHSYLLNKDKNSIIDSFYKNIIPLLQEYFFGDYSKVGLILGKGFVRLKEWDKGSDIFADFDDVADDFENRNVYEIIDYRKDEDYKLTLNKIEVDMYFEKAIQVLMNK